MRLRWTLRWLAASVFAVASAAGIGSDTPVATVGGRVITRAELQRALAAMPSFQRAALAKTDAELAARALDLLLVTPALLDAEAQRLELGREPVIKARLDGLLRDALVRKLAERITAAPEEVQTYYDENRRFFSTRESIRIWRVLLREKDLARDLLHKVAGAKGPGEWSRFAREHSIDEATKMRNGDLGFVRANGETHVPQVRVDEALFAAAAAVADGELVKEPIQEGDAWAVVWRRGSRPAVTHTLEEERERIARRVEQEKVDQSVGRLLGELRASSSVEVHPERLDGVEFPPPQLPQRPGTVSPSASASAPPLASAPRVQDRGPR